MTTGLDIADESIPVLEPPLTGSNWYAHSALTIDSHHRRMLAPRNGTLTFDQRFAVDWFRVSPSGKNAMYLPDWTRTRGEVVRSVGPGTVVKIVDGLPDLEFGVRSMLDPEITWDTIGGNLVVVRLDVGGFAWYEHLGEGTIAVRPNDRVDAGTPIAKIGASGNTGGAPHLHFELTDSPEKGLGNGLP